MIVQKIPPVSPPRRRFRARVPPHPRAIVLRARTAVRTPEDDVFCVYRTRVPRRSLGGEADCVIGMFVAAPPAARYDTTPNHSLILSATLSEAHVQWTCAGKAFLNCVHLHDGALECFLGCRWTILSPKLVAEFGCPEGN